MMIKDNLEIIKNKILSAAKKSGRNDADVKLM